MTSEELTKIYFANKHILQSPEWGEFKTLMGTKSIEVGNMQFTTHKVPFVPFSVGYAPKIRPVDLDLEKLNKIGLQLNCVFIKLDVSHSDEKFEISNSKFEIQKGKSVFARSTILIDLTRTEDELLSGMHEKTRYNLRLAQKKGVTIGVYSDPEEAKTKDALESFIRLQKETAERQKFFIHPDNYYRNCFKALSANKMAYLVSAKVGDKTAASWILFRYGDVLYYPYGESNYELRPYMASNLVMWEAIKLGKILGCNVFDLWGAAEDPENKNDPWYGFTRFKMSFGGTHIKLAQTYDLVINKSLYSIFNGLNNLRWKLLRITK